MSKKVSVYADSEKRYMFAFQSYKDKFFSPLLNLLVKFHISPNMLSFASIFFAFLFVFVINSSVVWAAVILAAGVFFDTIDGCLARFSNNLSPEGSFVDGFSDHMFILLSTIGFYLINLISLSIALIYFLSYTLLIVLIVLRAKKNIPFSWVLRPRFFVYTAFLFFVLTNFNVIPFLMVLFSIQMLIQSIWGFFKLGGLF